MYRPGQVDVFHPDYDTYPLFRQARCFDDVVRAGEMVFYPADYWHQTENQVTPSIAVSSSMLDETNWDLVAEELRKECDEGKYKWAFSAGLCKKLKGECYQWWKNRYDLKQERPTCPLRHDQVADSAAAASNKAAQPAGSSKQRHDVDDDDDDDDDDKDKFRHNKKDEL